MKKEIRFLAKILLLSLLLTAVLPYPGALAESLPTITISSPGDNYVTSANWVEIKGYATDTTLLLINGVTVYPSYGGAFSYTLTNLSPGANDVTVIALNSSGRTTTTTLTVFYEQNLGPSLNITSPGDNYQTVSGTVTVTGNAGSYDSLYYTVNNGPQVPVTAVSGQFSENITVDSVENVIVFTALKGSETATRTLHVQYVRSILSNITVDSAPYTDFFPVTTGSVTIAGVVRNGTSSVKINGSTVTITGNSFAKNVSLQEGLNSLSVVGTDVTGTSETRQLNIYYGPGQGPKIYNVSIADPWYAQNYTVKGTVRDADTVTVSNTTNNSSATVTISGSYSSPVSFSGTVTLVPGANNIIITATDRNGVANTFPTPGAPFSLPPYSVNYVVSAGITDVSPADGYQTSANTVTVSGKAINCKPGSLKINGESVSFNTSTFAFSKSVALKNGFNQISITAQDASGATVSYPVFYVEFLGGPNILNVLPADGTTVSTKEITITGTAVNTAGDGLKLFMNNDTNGTALSFGSGGYFSRAVILQEGKNIIKLTATDNVSTVTKTFIINYSTSPIIAVTAPDNGSTVSSDSVTITGKVFNTALYGLYINDQRVSFNSSDGSFSYSVKLDKTINDIVIKAYNGTLVTPAKVRVYYLGSPGIEITSHNNGDSVYSQDVELKGKVFPTDPSEISSFTINGVESKSRLSDGSFTSLPISLSSGDNEIELVLTTSSVKALDGSTLLPARTITRTLKLTYNDGPEIDISSPLDGSTVYSNEVTIYGTLKRADFNTLKIGDKEIEVSSGGSFKGSVTLQKGENEIKLEAKQGDKTTTETLKLNYDPIALDGSEFKTTLTDGGEAKAFSDRIKVKLAKGSTGIGTTLALSVTDPEDVDTPPNQSALVGPLFHLSWEDDEPTEPYKVTLKYDDVVMESQAYKVSVFRYDPDDDGWDIMGGTVDPKSRTISIDTDKTGYFAAAIYYQSFDDITHHWAKRDIEFLVARGAISGISKDKFNPDSNVTREEFVTFLVKALGIQPYNPDRESYDDVDKGDWSYQYIEGAARTGLISGVSHDYFAPKRPITREEAAILLSRAGNFKPVKEQEMVKVLSTFTDSDKISWWAKNDLAPVIKAKVLNGSDNGKFLPQNYATRAEAAAMIARLADAVNKPGR